MFRRRYLRIVLFFARSVLSVILWDLIIAHVGLRRWAERTRPTRLRRIAEGFRTLAVQLGGVLIKVGQFLSTRLDVLPEEVTQELAALQDEVPPEEFADIRRVVEDELGAPLAEHFAEFEQEPLAAASLGQVHRAKLKPPGYVPPTEGDEKSDPITDIVVKVLRPQIEVIIATDLAALRTLGSWLKRYPPIRRRVDLPSLLAEFTRILYEEIDYLAEGQNAETFGANFKGQAGVRVPRVVWTHTTKRVLALEDVYAIKITDYAGITAAGVDRVEVAQRLADTYMKQIFHDGFFHADPHPGNLFVRPLEEKGDWQLVFVDFGMAGHVPSNLRAGLRELVIAVGTKDASRMIQAYKLLGMLLPHADLKLLEQAEAMAFERFWGKSMAELRQISFQEMHEFAVEFRELVYTMPFQLPQDLILLGRTLAILFGMCTGLDPQFNAWESIVPYAQKLISEEASTGWEYWLGELGTLAQALLALPRRADTVLGKLERGELDVRVPELAGQISRMELATRRLAGAVVFAVLMMSGVQLYEAGQTTLGGSLLAAAAVALAWVLLAREKRG